LGFKYYLCMIINGSIHKNIKQTTKKDEKINKSD